MTVLDYEFVALYRVFAGTDACPPLLIRVSEAPEHPLGNMLASYDPQAHRIMFYEKELRAVFEERRAPIAGIMAMILCHEMTHSLCMNHPGISRWSVLHNGTQYVIHHLVNVLPEQLPPVGPGTMPLAIASVFQSCREFACERVSQRIFREHRQAFYDMVIVDE